MKIKIVSEFEDENLFYNHCIKYGANHQEHKPHYHDAYEIIFVRTCNVNYKIDDNTRELHKNTLVFTRPGQPHFIQYDDNSVYERHNLLFSVETIPESILSKIPSDLHTVNLGDNQLAIQLFEKMDYYCECLQGDALRTVMHALIQEIIICILIQSSAKSQFCTIKKHPLVEKTLEYIDDNLMNIPNIEDICETLSVSKSYLYQLFLNNLQMTPKRYITQRRLNFARQEILSGVKATAVYSLCGFADYSSFFRAYKKQFGYSPNETKKSVSGTYLL